MLDADRFQPPSLRSSGRIPELDGLRGVAIALVVVTHCLNIVATPAEAKYLQYLIGLLCRAKSFAWSGVDLFLVLSGFLIGGKLLDSRHSPDYFKTFYAKRARRILPAYFVFLGVMACAYSFLYPSHRAALAWPLDHPLPWYCYLTFTANLWMAFHNTYGAWGLAILWSLALEEQFYLIAPLVIRFVRPARLPHVFAAGIFSALLLRCLLQLARGHARLALYVLLPCRIDALLWGMLAAYLLRKPEVWNFLALHRRRLWQVCIFLGAGIGAASFVPAMSIHSVATTTIGYDWLDLFYATTLVLVLIDGDASLAKTMRQSWLVRLGTISYGLYLIHYMVYGLSMAYLLGRSGPVRDLADLRVAVFAIAMAVGLATLSWRYFEKPIVCGRFPWPSPAMRAWYEGGPWYAGTALHWPMRWTLHSATHSTAGMLPAYARPIHMSTEAPSRDCAITDRLLTTPQPDRVFGDGPRDPAGARAVVENLLDRVYQQQLFALRAAQRAATRSIARAPLLREYA
jgi:peptidoglycan/LPS O-acetylase OafA/YrhL